MKCQSAGCHGEGSEELTIELYDPAVRLASGAEPMRKAIKVCPAHHALYGVAVAADLKGLSIALGVGPD